MLARLEATAAAYSNPPTAEIREKLYAAAVTRNIPPEVLYAIAYQESGWRQFNSQGQPLISPDNGYGIMQVTSVGSYDVEKLKYDIDYNINAGADILLGKWQWVPSIGDDAMDCYENWFYAVWAYNGWVSYNSYPYTVYAHIASGGDFGWWPGVPATPVPQAWLVDGEGVQVPTPQPAHYWTPPLENYFSWYDGVYSNNWVLVANPATSPNSVATGISIAGAARDISQFKVPGQNPGVVPAGKAITAAFPGQMGGPVRVNTSREAIVSQRVLFGDSIEEVVSVPADKLSSHYYWPWYDMESAGFRNWVLINNPGSEAVRAEVLIDGQVKPNTLSQSRPDYGQDHFLIGPGETVTATFPGAQGGPVEVRAYRDGGAWASEQDRRTVIASQRVLSNFGGSFNEALGVPAESLSDDYYWPWYDGVGGRNWVLVANPNPSPVDYVIEVGAGGCSDPAPAGTACQRGTLAAAGDQDGFDIVTPEFPGIRTGPVRVSAQGGQVIAAQRVVFGPSFGETAGYPAVALAASYHWTWYDQLSPGMKNWVLVANPGPGDVTYTVTINGAAPAGYRNRVLAAGAMETPTFPGWRSGPVEVTASAPVIASQRVLFNGYFNEVSGTVLSEEG